MEKPLLIAGIDPGTTTAYALMDLDGNLISSCSGKQYALPELIFETVEKGDILFVASDKNPLPAFVQKYATKVGAKTITPDKDLLITEKKELTQNFREKIRNDHEMDAVSSAVYVFKKLSSTLQRIDSVLKQESKEGLKSQVRKLVLLNNINIKLALDIIERPNLPEVAVIKNAVSRKISEHDFYLLYEEFRKLRRENNLIKKQNESFQKVIELNKTLSEHLKKKIQKILPDNKAKQIIELKEKRLLSLYAEIARKNQEIEGLKNEIRMLNDYFLDMDKYVLAKKLANLTQQEYAIKNNKLKIVENDILLVDNPNIYSDAAYQELKEKVFFIISKTPVNEKTIKKGFVFLDSRKIGIIETEFFALANREDFAREKKSVSLIGKIIEEYRKERK